MWLRKDVNKMGFIAFNPETVPLLIAGGLFLADCQRERYIAIYMIVGGVIRIVLIISCVIQLILNRGRELSKTKMKLFDCILELVSMAWNWAGLFPGRRLDSIL